MFSVKNVKRLLLVLTVLSMIPVFSATWKRVVAESRARSVQFIVDSEEVWQMVMRLPDAGEDEYEAALQSFRDAGAEALAIYPISFGRLEERGQAISYDAKTFTQVFYGGGLPEIEEELGEPRVSHWYLLIPDEDLAEQVQAFLGDREESLGWRFIEGDERLVIEIPSINWTDYRRAGLWYDEEEIAQAQRLGFQIVARSSALPGQTAQQLQEQFEPLIESGAVTMLLPTGNALSGNVGIGGIGLSGQPKALQEYIDLFADQGWTYGLIENMNQLDSIRFSGDGELLKQRDFQAIRIYAIQRAELDKENWLDADGIVDRWFRAVVDRNIRGVYVRLFHGSFKDPQRILDFNADLVRRSTAQIAEAGYPLATPVALEPLHLANTMLSMAPALALAGAWFCINWYPWRKAYVPIILTVLALGGVSVIAYLSRSNGTLSGSWISMRQMLGLAAHLVYPTLAGMVAILVLEMMPRQVGAWRVWLHGIALAVLGFVVTLFGGITLGNLMTDNLFMLELDYFRGVKLSYLLPIVLFGLWFFVRYGLVMKKQLVLRARNWDDLYQDILDLFRRPLSLGLLAVLGVAALAGWYYLGRSGHEAGVAISDLELQLRSWLEGLLTARPRNKEFLIGYPLLMLLPFLWQKRSIRWMILPAGAVAMTGLISTVNSFAHIRTPLMISIERSFYGLLLGLLVGTIILLAAYLLYFIARKLGLVPADRDE